MKTLYCKVGRAAAQPLATGTDAELDAVKTAKVADLIRSGVALDRVEFTTSGSTAAKKGK